MCWTRGSKCLVWFVALACSKQQPSDMQPKSGFENSAKLGEIVVLAGAFDRDRSIVTFPLNVDAAGELVVRDASGVATPLQRNPNGTATFVLRSLAAGQRAVFALEQGEASTQNSPRVIERGKALELAVNTRPVVRFLTQGELPPGVDPVYLRGGYLHPLYTPGGVEVTGDYPDSHHHQHGIWSAWTRTRFRDHAIDFWNMGDKQGKVDFRAMEQIYRGPVFAGFSARLEYVDLLGSAPVVALAERWTVMTYQTHEETPPYFVVDLESKQETTTDSALLLEQYTYGGFALRGNAEWSDPANVTFVTSEGLDRASGDDKKGRWCFIGGKVNGALVGFAMLGHPKNFRAPQTFRIHPKHPYMAFAPVKDGPFSIEPGKPYSSRFRIVSFDGPLDRALMERLWNDYATPPEVIVEVR